MGWDADARHAFHAICKGNYTFECESRGGKSKTQIGLRYGKLREIAGISALGCMGGILTIFE